MEGLDGGRVLVTGASGFVGAAVVDALIAAGAQVSAVDRQPPPDPRVHGIAGDLADPEVRDAAVTPDLDGIVHLAAATSVLRSMEDPAGVYHTNVGVTGALLELTRQRGVGRFLLASTNAVTGDVGRQPIHEDLPLRPLTPYGATKAACEMLLAGYSASYGIDGAALRLTNVYGPRMQHKDSFVARLLRAALAGGGVQVYGHGMQLRDFVHVDDVAAAVLLVWRVRHRGPLVIGSGRSVTVNELVELARAVTGAPLPVEHVAPKPGEMPAVVVDLARARALGYRPAVALPEGLGRAWDDWRAAHAAGAPVTTRLR